MAGRVPECVIEAREPIRLHDRCEFAVFGARDTLHRISVEVFECNMGDHAIRIAFEGLNDLYTLCHGLSFVSEPNRLGQRVTTLFGIDEIHKRGRLDASETGLSDGAVTKLCGIGTSHHHAQHDEANPGFQRRMHVVHSVPSRHQPCGDERGEFAWVRRVRNALSVRGLHLRGDLACGKSDHHLGTCSLSDRLIPLTKNYLRLIFHLRTVRNSAKRCEKVGYFQLNVENT